jgi:hypothetical protein
MHVPAPKPATAVAMCACLSDDLRRENNNNITSKQDLQNVWQLNTCVCCVT